MESLGIFLYKILETAAAEATQAFVSIAKSKFGERKSKILQHQLSYNPAVTEEAIRDHLALAETWSESIQLLGLTKPRSLKEVYIDLTISDDPRLWRMGTASGPRLRLADAIAKQTSFVLLGDPGSGKTTSLKKITGELCEELKKGNPYMIPIVFRLREFREGQNLHDSLKRLMQIQFVEERPPQLSREDARIEEENFEPYEEFSNAETRSLCAFLDTIGALIILDGFDELSPTAKSELLDEIDRMSMRLKKARIVLSSRSGELKRVPWNFLVFEIAPLSRVQLEDLVRMWFTADTSRRYSPSDFLEALHATPYEDLATRPLNLVNLCLVFEKYGALPGRPVSVYRKIINLLLEEWDAERGVKRVSTYAFFDPPRKLDFLAAFAFHLTVSKGNRLEFTDRDLEDIYLKVCERYELPATEARSVAREIESHSGIVVKSGYETYEFSHKSLQEYLVAEYISRLRDLPNTVSLLRTCPNELAISVALSSDSTDWFCGLFRDKSARIKPKAEWLLPFISRLVLERPGLAATAELGGTVLWLLSRCPDVIPSARGQQFLEMPAVESSIRLFLEHSEIRKGDLISVLLRSRFDSKHPIPVRLDFSKESSDLVRPLRSMCQ